MMANKETPIEGQFEPLPRRRRLGRDLLAFSLTIFVGIASVFAVQEFVFQPFVIPSESMTPTLKLDQKILVDRTSIVSGGIHRGDIVVFKDPGGWIGSAQTNPLNMFSNVSNFIHYGTNPVPANLVKRVVGIGGDRVTCCSSEGKLEVNGKAVTEPYLSAESLKASDTDFDLVVPEGSYWVMGDNRVGSADSRSHTDLPTKGFVSEKDIKGVVLAITWPMDQIHWLLHANTDSWPTN